MIFFLLINIVGIIYTHDLLIPFNLKFDYFNSFVCAFIYHCNRHKFIDDKNEFYEVKYKINTLSGIT